MNDFDTLNCELLAAHGAKDSAKIAGIYKRAGHDALANDQVDHACFYFTHAYVFALESNSADQDEIHQILKSYGREE